jgi:hypothetical protein
MRRHRLTVLLLLAIACTSRPAAAQAGERPNPLTTITGLTCRFPIVASAVWQDGKPEATVAPQDLSIVVSEIDVQEGTAQLRGAQGGHFATAVLSAGSLYFLESDRGSLDVTTDFATEGSPGTLKAVRARHGYVFLTVPPFGNDPTVSQSYGECTPTPAIGGSGAPKAP